MSHYHLIGVGGVGMSALAEALIAAGCRVTGSDRFYDQGRKLPVLQLLEEQGVELFPQDGSGVEPSVDAVVVSSAIEVDNPDLVAAKTSNKPIWHRSQALAKLLETRCLVAVTGTCGKSTLTAMLGHILVEAGLSPCVVNGAACVNWADGHRTGAVYWGGGSLCVIEADESDKSLFNFNPTHVLVSNCSADHFSLDESNQLFDAFLAKAQAASLDGRHDATKCPAVRELEWGCAFDWDGVEVELALPGRHNALNAWQAMRMASRLGVSSEISAKALKSFRGVQRRLECVGCREEGVRVVDEYAHNTEKIRATLQTLQQHSQRILAVWRPHGYGPLRKMFADLETMFAETLRPQDRLYLLPVFDVGGTADRTIQSTDLETALVARGVCCEGVLDHAHVRCRIEAVVSAGDIIVVMGARDPGLRETAFELAHVPEGFRR